MMRLFFFSSRRRHTRLQGDWSSDVCSSDLWHVSGPMSPDTVFLRAAAGDFDAVIAMYHDQGHIPSKFAGFDDTVNVTLGLPIVRTSVDHGTAYDIAGTGKANEANLLAAIDLAAQMAANRQRRLVSP